MADRLDDLIAAVQTVFGLAGDRELAADILEAALARLVNPPAGVDAMGAPLLSRNVPEIDWPVLRQAVKASIAVIGLDEAARQAGMSSVSLRDTVFRRREPGLGRKARFLQIVRHATGDFDGRIGNFAGSPTSSARH